MIDTMDFAKQAEQDLRVRRKIGPSTCQIWDDLSPASKAAFASALNFLGCGANEPNGQWGGVTDETDRIAACRLMLLACDLDKDEPVWSSYMLDRMLEAVMQPPGAAVGDLFNALYDLLANHQGAPSGALANLIKQLVILCFTRQRRSYDSMDWSRFAHQASADATPAQLYFLLHALPPALVNAEVAQAITLALAASPFQAEAAAALAG